MHVLARAERGSRLGIEGANDVGGRAGVFLVHPELLGDLSVLVQAEQVEVIAHDLGGEGLAHAFVIELHQETLFEGPGPHADRVEPHQAPAGQLHVFDAVRRAGGELGIVGGEFGEPLQQFLVGSLQVAVVVDVPDHDLRGELQARLGDLHAELPDQVIVKIRCSPGGILEQEDSEAWMQQFKGSNIDFADDRPYYYGLGLGEEADHPDLPGLVDQTANEFYARHFFLRWRDALKSVEAS